MTRTISRLANELNISVETIRFYERKTLIEQPRKPEQGYRHYPDETVNRIHFIKRAQELGFTLEEVSHLLSLEDFSCSDVQELTKNKLGAVQAKIKDLRHLESALKALLSQCNTNEDEASCPIIHSLQPK